MSNSVNHWQDVDITIPSSLRTVAPFLDEAQSVLRNASSNGTKKKIAIYCIDHAFNLVNQFDLPLDSEARGVLNEFLETREALASSILVSVDHAEAPYISAPSNIPHTKPHPEDVLVAEATETLELAEEQFKAGMTQAAARNFHTATIYFRVLESLVPRLSKDMHVRLQYAASRTKQCSHLLENFVHEHFEGKKCSDYYDIFESKRLGKGSYGAVYLCRHKRSGDEFACKVINVNRVNSHYLRKLHLEIAIMKEVDHPNIIKLREVFFGHRTVYLVMELCTGGELFDRLTGHSKKGFEESFCARLVRDMLSSLCYLHGKGIVHRDLKLENFLFETTSAESPLKLIDFGLSKHYDERENMHQVVGSAYYTAPEVLKGSYDQRCDVWSLGVIAYMLLSGSPPFYGPTSDAIHDMIQNQEPEFPSRKFSHVSDAAIDFLRKVLVKDPSERITPEAALQHPFIQNLYTDDGSKVTRRPEASTDVVQALSSFLRMSRFKKLMLEVVAFSLNSTQIAMLRDEFNAIDSDRSGTISMRELQQSMSVAGLSRGGAHVGGLTDAFRNMPVEDGVEINYNEFIAAAMCRRIEIDEERLMLAFETLDSNGSGYLDADCIRRALGGEWTNDEIENMMIEADFDGDGRIDYMEFMKFWRNLTLTQNLTPIQRFSKAVRRVTRSLSLIKAMKAGVVATRVAAAEAAAAAAAASGDLIARERTYSYDNVALVGEGGGTDCIGAIPEGDERRRAHSLLPVAEEKSRRSTVGGGVKDSEGDSEKSESVSPTMSSEKDDLSSRRTSGRGKPITTTSMRNQQLSDMLARKNQSPLENSGVEDGTGDTTAAMAIAGGFQGSNKRTEESVFRK